MVFDDQANGTARDFFREKIAEKIEDRELAKKLIPDFPIGCKRLCVDTDYYEIYNQDHVQLVDINEQLGPDIVDRINRKGGRANFFSCDVSKDDDVSSSMRRTVEDFGSLSIIVNNAAVSLVE